MTIADASTFQDRPAARQGGGIHWLVMAFLVALLLPLSTSVAGTVFTTLRLVVVLSVVPLAIGLFQGRFGRILPTDWLFVGHTIWMGVSLSVTSPAMAASQFGSVGAEFLGSYLIGRALIRDKAQFLAVVRFLIWAVVLLAPFAMIEMVRGRPPLIDILDKIPVLNAPAVIWTGQRLNLNRAQVLFVHPIHWGLFCSALFTLGFIGLRGTVSVGLRIFFAAAIGFGTFASLASGALLPVILQLALIAWALTTEKLQRRWWILLAIIVVLYVAIELLSNRSAMMAVLTRLAFSSHNVYWRSIIFDWGWMNIFGSAANGIPPARLFGIGFNDWIRPAYMYSGSMDNFWLVIGVRHGVPGFLTLAGGMTWLVWTAARRDMGPDPQIRNIRLAWVLTFVSLGLSMATVHVWGTIYGYIFFMLGAGAWLTTFEPEAAAGKPDPHAEESPRRRTRIAYSRFAPPEDDGAGTMTVSGLRRAGARDLQGNRPAPQGDRLARTLPEVGPRATRLAEEPTQPASGATEQRPTRTLRRSRTPAVPNGRLGDGP